MVRCVAQLCFSFSFLSTAAVTLATLCSSKKAAHRRALSAIWGGPAARVSSAGQEMKMSSLHEHRLFGISQHVYDIDFTILVNWRRGGAPRARSGLPPRPGACTHQLSQRGLQECRRTRADDKRALRYLQHSPKRGRHRGWTEQAPLVVASPLHFFLGRQRGQPQGMGTRAAGPAARVAALGSAHGLVAQRRRASPTSQLLPSPPHFASRRLLCSTQHAVRQLHASAAWRTSLLGQLGLRPSQSRGSPAWSGTVSHRRNRIVAMSSGSQTAAASKRATGIDLQVLQEQIFGTGTALVLRSPPPRASHTWRGRQFATHINVLRGRQFATRSMCADCGGLPFMPLSRPLQVVGTAVLVVCLSVSNRVLQKLALVPMKARPRHPGNHPRSRPRARRAKGPCPCVCSFLDKTLTPPALFPPHSRQPYVFFLGQVRRILCSAFPPRTMLRTAGKRSGDRPSLTPGRSPACRNMSAQALTLVYVLAYGLVLLRRYRTGSVTDEMLRIPMLPFIAIGLLECMAQARAERRHSLST